jgi:hypothetical protein
MKAFIKGTFVLALGAISTLYLINPTAGIFELIPDNMPLVGNLDEFAASALLLNCLAYFGLNVRLFSPHERTNKSASHAIKNSLK